MDNRLKFIYSTIGSMLAIALLLAVFEVLRYSTFIALSYATFLVLSRAFNMQALPRRAYRRLVLLWIAGGIATACLVGYEVVRIVGDGPTVPI